MLAVTALLTYKAQPYSLCLRCHLPKKAHYNNYTHGYRTAISFVTVHLQKYTNFFICCFPFFAIPDPRTPLCLLVKRGHTPSKMEVTIIDFSITSGIYMIQSSGLHPVHHGSYHHRLHDHMGYLPAFCLAWRATIQIPVRVQPGPYHCPR